MSRSVRGSGSRSRSGFIERALVDINDTLEHSVFAENIARQRGLLQAFDPRLKAIALVALAVAVSLSHSPAVIAALYLVGLVLAAYSAIPLGSFIKRVWVAVVLFTGIVAFPALFFTPGPVL